MEKVVSFLLVLMLLLSLTSCEQGRSWNQGAEPLVDREETVSGTTEEGIEESMETSTDFPEETNAAVVASGNCGPEGSESAVKWSLDSDGTLTISGKAQMGKKGQMGDWDYFDSVPWYDFREKIKRAVIQSGVTSIGSYAFVTVPHS